MDPVLAFGRGSVIYFFQVRILNSCINHFLSFHFDRLVCMFASCNPLYVLVVTGVTVRMVPANRTWQRICIIDCFLLGMSLAMWAIDLQGFERIK